MRAKSRFVARDDCPPGRDHYEEYLGLSREHLNERLSALRMRHSCVDTHARIHFILNELAMKS